MFINFSNHGSSFWSEEQINAASEYGEIRDIQFPNVAPEANEEDIAALASDCVKNIMALNPQAVMCQGEYTLTFAVVSELMKSGVICLSACTKRITTETVLPDGTTKKDSVFKFEKFRKFAV